MLNAVAWVPIPSYNAFLTFGRSDRAFLATRRPRTGTPVRVSHIRHSVLYASVPDPRFHKFLRTSSSVLIGSRVFIWERNSLACTASHSRAFALRLGNANRIRRAIEHPVLPTCTALRRLRVDPDADVVHLKDAGRLRPLFASPRPPFASPIHALARPPPARRYHVRVPEFEWPRPLRAAAWQSP
jgi:hypothetical protein